MKRITAILLAALLIVAMAMPVFADETQEVTSSAGEFTYDAESGTISGSYESDGLVELYLDGKLAGSDNINKPAEPGDHTVSVYVDGVFVKDVPVTAGAAEEPNQTEDPGQTDPGTTEPTQQDNPTVTPTQPENTTTTTTTPAKTASNVPKTGDAENMGTFMVLGLGAALTLAAAKRIKSR